MFYTLYKITNLLNKKIYVGVHKTSTLNDGYMGSGKIIKAAIKKHGRHNFLKEIMMLFEDAQKAFIAEAEIVNEEFVKRLDTYNVKIGGRGGFDHISLDAEQKKIKYDKVSKTLKTKVINNPDYLKKLKASSAKGGEGTQRRILNDPSYRAIVKKRFEVMNAVRLVCPHCGTEAKPSNSKRWHFDNCKHKITGVE